MNVVLDARWIPERLSGIGLYTTELIRALAREDAGIRLTLLFHRESLLRRVMEETGAARTNWISARLAKSAPEHPLAQVEIPALLRKLEAQVYHSPNYLVPLAAFPRGRPGRIRCIATLHDLIPLRFPEYTPRALKTRFFPVYRAVLRACASRLDLALAPSESTRRDVEDCLGIPGERIRVTPEAAGAAYTPDPRAVRAADEILYVGRADPYKNLAGLVDATDRLRRRGMPVRLRILGSPDPRYPEAQALAAERGLDDAVRWEGYRSGADLVNAYRRAAVFVLPSRIEGFGLPVLEAMACGCPVVCSDRASLPEVAGDAALRVNPDEPDALAEAISRVLSDPALAASLSEKGVRRAASFTWDRTAALTRSAWFEAARLPPALIAEGGGA